MSSEPSIAALERQLLSPEADLSHLSAEEQLDRLLARVATSAEPVVTPAGLLEQLRASKASGRPLRVKLGIDPTGPEIHIGHAVPLLNLRLFQRMGHRVVLVIGDFTAMIGDPSGRVDARAALTVEDIHRNMATYEDQAARIIDLRDPSIERRYNSEWMERLGMRRWVEMTKRISISELLQREDFRKRLAAGHGFSVGELEYAIFMAFDSVVLAPDVEIGGMDQYLNLHMCRQVMENAGQKPETIITYNLLSGTTGERDAEGRLVKMSKSRGNYIPVTADPADMYGKVMSIPDDVMWTWYRELTEITPDDLAALRAAVEEGKIHPKEAKRLLARAVVAAFNHFDRQVVAAAEADFDSKFGKQAVLVPESTETVTVGKGQSLVESLAGATGRSKNDIRRLTSQGGIRLLRDGEYAPLADPDLQAPAASFDGAVLRIGKRQYLRLELGS